MGKGRKKQQLKKRYNQLMMASKAEYVTQWASLGRTNHLASSEDLLEWIPASATSSVITNVASSLAKPPAIDLHTHSTCSDGMLSPTELLEKAAKSGVQVLALTDHDTMAGVPAAINAANKFGIRLIPGVEISAKIGARVHGGIEEPVHILGYYSCCGPARWQELERNLSKIREGRYHRAETIINKLKSLEKPVTWERVISLAGVGVAPGRVHVARALVEAGHVDNIREAFNKYLYDGGPAYALGYELAAEDAVRLVCDTGGVAALAHPWALKDPVPVVKQLKAAGLHAMEVYRGDGKANGFADLADAFGLLKLGGSDFHGRGNPEETKLGKVALPLVAISEFLSVAAPIWCAAIKDLLQCFAQETFEIRSGKLVGLKYFTGHECLKGDVSLNCYLDDGRHNASLKLTPWLTEDERLAAKEEIAQVQLKYDTLAENGKVSLLISRQVF